MKNRRVVALVGVLLIIACALVTYTVHARSVLMMSGGVTAAAPATAACSGGCPGTTSDVACEDWDGETECYTGFASRCRCDLGWVYTQSGTNCVLDPAYAVTNACTDEGTYGLQMVKANTTSDEDLGITYDRGAGTLTRWFVSFMFYITSEGLGNTNEVRFMTFFNNSTNWYLQSGLYLRQATGKLYLAISDSVPNYGVGLTEVVAGTWYKVGFDFNADGTSYLYLTTPGNAFSTAEASISTTASGGAAVFSLGSYATDYNYSFIIDSLKMDDDTMPDPCGS